MSRLLHGLAVACAVSAARPAFAQVEVETRFSSSRVGAGEPFQLQLQVLSSTGEEPTGPRLPVPTGIQVQGPSLRRQSQVSITNGRMVQNSGVTATWTLIADRPGTYRLGPPSMDVGGQRHAGKQVVITVVPQGSAVPSPRGVPHGRMPFDPFQFFDPFGGGSPFGRSPFEDDLQPSTPQFPPELAVERALDPTAFVIARAKPQRVVLGQAVRLSVYAYGSRGPFAPAETEPSREGFLAYAVDLEQSHIYQLPIEDRQWFGAKISEYVLFPIRTGNLRIGSVRVSFSGRGYPASGAGGLPRESQPVEVTVVEPPLAGRPPGYRLGDVGSYKLSASVEPRSVRQGESVAVIAKLEGVGNVPPKLSLPQQTGVEWMEPTVVEKIEAQAGVVRGHRTFTFVVKVDRSGSVDLGELSLPFYDPDRRRYEVARATLGSVEVSPSPNAGRPAPTSTKAEDRLSGLLAPVAKLGQAPPPPSYWTDHRSFWLLLLSGPLGVLSAGGLVQLGRRYRQRFAARHERPEQRALRELAGAREHAARGELVETAAAVERAVHVAIEGATTIKSRGLLRSELGPALRQRGVPTDVAEQTVRVLEATESARFVKAESGAEAADLHRQGAETVKALQRGRRA